MYRDRRHLDITAANSLSVTHLDTAIRSFLAHRADTADHLARALAADPQLILGHVFRGFLLLLLGRSELFLPARQAHAAARSVIAARGATTRETQHCEALALWLDGEMERSAALLEAALMAQPLDALGFKLLHALLFLLGDAAGMRRAAETALPAWSRDMPEFGFVLGCHAFALEETGALDVAERRGRDAIEIEPQDVWAAHAVAHVYETRRQADAGIAWLRPWQRRLAGINNFAAHLRWHEALFLLARGDKGAALALYDEEIRRDRTDDYRDIANAASLLWRLARAGCDVGERWRELADLAEARMADRALVFAQLNYLLCLVGAGRPRAAAAMHDAMRRWVREARGTQARILSSVGIPMARILTSPRRHDAARLTARDLQAIGGSNAQRSVFERILAGAALPAAGDTRSFAQGPEAARPPLTSL